MSDLWMLGLIGALCLAAWGLSRLCDGVRTK
jgi:hypothetical protein